jgi:hypothetical protein
MPRYFFNVMGAHASVDDEGEQLADDETAWREATIIAGELFKNIDGRFRPGQSWSLEVADENKKPIYFIRINAETMK